MTIYAHTEGIYVATRPQFKALTGGPTRAPSADEIRGARERLGMDHETFAAMIGVAVDRFRTWESGERRVSMVRDRQVIWWASSLTECPFCHQSIPIAKE